MIAARAECQNRAAHVTGEPSGYVAWHEWAEKKAVTHTQERCPGCGLYVIWRPKQLRAALASAEGSTE